MSSQFTSVPVRPSTRETLAELKPFRSMSYDELLVDMVEVYKEQRGGMSPDNPVS